MYINIFAVLTVYYTLYGTFSTFLFRSEHHFPRSFFPPLQCKQVRALCEYYKPSYLLLNTVCTRGISFCRVRYLLMGFLSSLFQGEILNRRRASNGRATKKNWRMLMNKNAWKNESFTRKQTQNKYWNINVPVVNDFMLDGRTFSRALLEDLCRKRYKEFHS